MRRPGVFALLFWSVLAVTCVSYAFGLYRQDSASGPLPVSLTAAALVAGWVALPWDPRAGRWRKLVSLLFPFGVLALGSLAGSVWPLGLYAIPFANGVFAFGFVRGCVHAGAVLPVIFVHYAHLLGDLYPGREGVVPQALLLAVLWVPVAVFLIGVCATILEAVGRREETQNLLADLEAAHAKLEFQAGRTRELAISEERARMAREVHDSVGHHLTAIHLQLQNAQRFRDGNPERAWKKVSEARELALSALSEVRRSVRALRPPALEERSGPGALAALTRGFDGGGPEVRFVVGGERRPLPEKVELVLYRAMQEGLANAARHADARTVRATLTYADGAVGLVVADDGRGAGDAGCGDGFGLAGLEERVAALGGGFSAGDGPGGGFRLEVRLPAGNA